MTESTLPTGEWFDGMAAWSRGQRRWLGALGLLFVALTATAPLGWLLLRPVKTQSSVPPPEWNWATVENGAAMRQLERHVKESSWLTFQVRGVFNETLLELGVLDSDQVVIGNDGWMYYAPTMRWQPELLERTRDRRREVLRAALDLVRLGGAELLLVPVPDTVTIYPEFVPPGRLDAGRTQLYDVILADAAAVGVPCVDVRAAMRARRAAHPDELLYYRRDTHWGLAGQQTAAAAVRDHIHASGWIDRIRPEPDLIVLGAMPQTWVPGLVSMLGLRAESEFDEAGWSPTVRRLVESAPWTPVHLRGPGGAHRHLPLEFADATVALCGTSYSETFGYQLCAALGTVVDRRCVVPGGGSFAGIRKLIAEVVNRRFLPRIVVWEFVERDYQIDWPVTTSLVP
ncbi:MAG: hypothetical protein JNL08_13460 [Planctomycetes bacterium]|nr:hypothetical protein [Planctomycetota bacterium]